MKIYRKNISNEQVEMHSKAFIEMLMKDAVCFPRKNEEGNKETKDKDNRKAESALSGDEIIYLLSVYDHEFLAVTRRAEMLGLSSYLNDKTKKTLVQKRLIEEYQINLGASAKGTVKLTHLTEKGHLAIGKKPKHERKHQCSHEHWFWQRAIKFFYETKGKKPEIEYSMNGKNADVGLFDEDGIIAVEVELSPNNAVQNIQRNLDAGFIYVFCMCKNTSVLKSVAEKLNSVLDESKKPKVHIGLLHEMEPENLVNKLNNGGKDENAR